MAETGEARFQREWIELLNELRVALSGVQFLFAFLLAVPFAPHFDRLDGIGDVAYVVCFLSTAASTILLMAPTVYHRLHWRLDIRDKDRMQRTSNRLAVGGISFLAVAMCAAVLLVGDYLLGPVLGWLPTIATFAGVTLFWFAMPLWRRQRDRADAARALDPPPDAHHLS